MEKQLATTLFESLASGVRLDIFRLLVKNAPDGLVAGEIATLLALPPTNLSFHLKAGCYSRGAISTLSRQSSSHARTDCLSDR
jgi:DNA-binding transcriptional ArsR family regulator